METGNRGFKKAENKKGLTAQMTLKEKAAQDKADASKFANDLNNKVVLKVGRRTWIYSKSKEKNEHIYNNLIKDHIV